MITVLDASAAVAIALNMPESTKFLQTIDTSDVVISPDLFVSEVSNALWKYVKAGIIDADQGNNALERAVGLVDSFEPARLLYKEAFTLSVNCLHPVYDALYLILARRNNGVLATLDRRMADLAANLHIKTF